MGNSLKGATVGPTDYFLIPVHEGVTNAAASVGGTGTVSLVSCSTPAAPTAAATATCLKITGLTLTSATPLAFSVTLTTPTSERVAVTGAKVGLFTSAGNPLAECEATGSYTIPPITARSTAATSPDVSTVESGSLVAYTYYSYWLTLNLAIQLESTDTISFEFPAGYTFAASTVTIRSSSGAAEGTACVKSGTTLTCPVNTGQSSVLAATVYFTTASIRSHALPTGKSSITVQTFDSSSRKREIFTGHT